MSKVICLYYTRTGKTKGVVEKISKKLNAEMVEYTDGKCRDGVLGYIKTCFECFSKRVAYIKDVKSKFKLKDYDIAIIAMPIWVEDCCKVGKAFLMKYKDELPENVYFAITHMTKNINYENKILKLDKYLNVKSKGFLSLCSEKKENDLEIERFVDLVKGDMTL